LVEYAGDPEINVFEEYRSIRRIGTFIKIFSFACSIVHVGRNGDASSELEEKN
jgi:hypothetical protein